MVAAEALILQECTMQPSIRSHPHAAATVQDNEEMFRLLLDEGFTGEPCEVSGKVVPLFVER